jgi:transposase
MAMHYELFDEDWNVVPVLNIETHGRPLLRDRLILDGVPCVFCSNAAWPDMPERFDPWSTVHQRFRGW